MIFDRAGRMPGAFEKRVPLSFRDCGNRLVFQSGLLLWSFTLTQ